MKKLIFIFLIFCHFGFAQEYLYNKGKLQIHDGANLGLHTNLMNDGVFDQNKGTVGFYGNELTVFGSSQAIFNNVEVDLLNVLELQNSIGVRGSLSFISGTIRTPRGNSDIKLEFLNFDAYAGEGASEHVNGYVGSFNSGEFVFPIGDGFSLRPMILPNQEENTFFTGAYFRDNIDNPTHFSGSFSAENAETDIKLVQSDEFWQLKGSTNTNVILTWNADSKLDEIVNKIEHLCVVGWEKSSNKWVSLGNTAITGDLISGSINSDSFVPDNYEIITIGSKKDINDGSYNYVMSINDDGINDVLEIKGIQFYPKNKITVFNRWGAIVFSKENYKNDWNGISNSKYAHQREAGLARGTYYYVLELPEENDVRTGYIFLTY